MSEKQPGSTSVSAKEKKKPTDNDNTHSIRQHRERAPCFVSTRLLCFLRTSINRSQHVIVVVHSFPSHRIGAVNPAVVSCMQLHARWEFSLRSSRLARDRGVTSPPRARNAVAQCSEGFYADWRSKVQHIICRNLQRRSEYQSINQIKFYFFESKPDDNTKIHNKKENWKKVLVGADLRGNKMTISLWIAAPQGILV